MAGIFLSCVSQEFHGPTQVGAELWPGSYRSQLAHHLQECGQSVVYQETFALSGGDLLAKLDSYIRDECQAVVHLIGDARGWCLEDDLSSRSATSDAVASLLARYGETFLAGRPGLRQQLLARGFHGLSVTQWEAYLALHHNKPLFICTFADSAERHPAFQLEAAPPPDRVSQAEHLAWLRQTGCDRKEQIGSQFLLKEKVIAGLVRLGVIAKSESSLRPRCDEFTSIGSLFMGRSDDMERLQAALRKAPATAITASQVIHGQGGIGKTRLAIEFGLAHAEHYTALLFVGAESPQSFEANLARLAGPLVLDLGLPENEKDDVKLKAVLQWLRAHSGYFLILDNVDSEAAAQAVEQRLAQFHNGHVVITSRITQWSDSVEPLHLDVLSEDAATAFLLQATLRDPHSRRSVTPTDDADARCLAQDVDGLALALEQSAAFIRTKQTTIARYRERWQKFDLKVRDYKDKRLTKYPHSVLTTWETTFEQLPAGAVTLLRVCSVLAPAPISLHLLESVVPDCEDDLSELSRFSLASRSEDGAAIRVHKVVQEIVYYRMEESDQTQSTEKVLDELGTLFRDKDDHTRMPRRSELLPHLAAVISHAESAPRLARTCAQFRADVAYHLWLIGQLPAALAHINAAIKWGQRQSPVDERSVAIWRATRALIRQHQGDLPGAVEDITDSIEWSLGQSPVDERSLAIWRITRASIRQYQGDLPGAMEDITDSIEWCLRQSPVDERGLAIWRASRATIRQHQGDLPGALEDITDSIDWGLRQSPVHEHGLAIWRSTRASIRRDQGDLPGAVEDITYSIEWLLRQSPVDDRKVAIWRSTRASIRQDQGDLSGAVEDITYSIEWSLRQSPAHEHGVAICRSTRAEILRDQGELASARIEITLALAWFEQHLPGDTRTIDIMRQIRDSIDPDPGGLETAWL